MNARNISVGMEVHFRTKVFAAPYAPYYDAYAGQKFKVRKLHTGGHVSLVCISNPKVIVDGMVHDNELEQA